MIYEIIYSPEIFDKFEDYVKNVFKINFEKDCFVYFYYGEKVSKYLKKESLTYLEAYTYTKKLEDRFNVNINWVDLSFIFDNIKYKVDENDLERVIFYWKLMYFNSFEKMIKKMEL